MSVHLSVVTVRLAPWACDDSFGGQEFGRASSGCTLALLIMMDGQHKWHILCNVFFFHFLLVKTRKNEEANLTRFRLKNASRYKSAWTNTLIAGKFATTSKEFHVLSKITKSRRAVTNVHEAKKKTPAMLRKTIKPTPRRNKRWCFHSSWHFFFFSYVWVCVACDNCLVMIVNSIVIGVGRENSYLCGREK